MVLRTSVVTCEEAIAGDAAVKDDFAHVDCYSEFKLYSVRVFGNSLILSRVLRLNPFH